MRKGLEADIILHDCQLSLADDMSQNPYIEATLINTLSFIAHSKGDKALRAFSVSIHGDNAFYVMENEVNGLVISSTTRSDLDDRWRASNGE